MTLLLQVPGSEEDEPRPVDSNQVFSIPRRLRTPPDIKPGPEHISPKQVKALQELVWEAADHDIAAGRSDSGSGSEFVETVEPKNMVSRAIG